MKKIMLTRSRCALIDDSDFDDISRYRWQAHFDGYNWYAARRKGNTHETMHVYLMKPPIGVEIDHRDGNGLNNQRANLRICLHFQNMANRKKGNGHTSKFKGVCWKKKNKKWCAQLSHNGTVRHLGLFECSIDAAKAYDAAAVSVHGEFAMTNAQLGLIP